MHIDRLREVKETFESWWNKNLDRPLIQVFSPKDPSGDTWSFLRHYPDADKALDEILESFSKILVEKEAYPNVFVNLGPGSLSAYLGAELKFDCNANTAWFLGSSTLNGLQEIEFNTENKWWRYTVECTKKATKRSQGRTIVAFTDLLDPLTVSGQLRGNFPTTLIKDMFTNGHKLKKAVEKIHNIWFRCYNELCKAMNVSKNGYSTWAGLWSELSHYVLQCDTIVFLSPKLFDEFVYPFIVEECNYLDRTIWHLDGPLELKHLDKLLNITELDAIQWIPGEGNPDGGDKCWIPLYKKIQSKGKLLQIFVPSEKVMPILSRISPQNVAINTTCRTSEEAQSLIRAFESKYG